MLGVTNPLNGIRQSQRRPLLLRYDRLQRPLPRRLLGPQGLRDEATNLARPFDLTGAIQRLVSDIARRSPEFAHIDPQRMLITFTPSRNRSRYGLQARVTPLRFRQGAMIRRQAGVLYGVQRYFVDDCEMLYLMTFCLPRFLDQSFEEKLITVFHEMYHISPAFDGDLRRHPGRCEWHTHSQKQYDRHMSELVRAYLVTQPDETILNFLKFRTSELIAAYGPLSGVVVPRPKLIPLSW